MTKQEFLTAAIAAARDASRTSGLPPGVTVAQAALESAWGKSGLSRQANNYFGIKAHKGHESVQMGTTEVTNGVAARTTARFAKYASMAECFADRDRLILTLPVYAEAKRCAQDPEAFVRALAKHWATDPEYADKLLRTWRANKLNELDQTNSHQQPA
ncbi:MAG TPA: glucosaminidase domain-containing protein [Terriglobales bacterium]|nr:glucosaminidase domain-containing protein [Terriglobales bacterium]